MLVLDIQDMLPCFTSAFGFHVFWEGNMVADWIAKRGVLLKDDLTFFSSPSSELTCVIRDDSIGRTLERMTI